MCEIFSRLLVNCVITASIERPGFPSHTKTGQSYSAIILTVWFQADHTLDHEGLWFQADHTLDIYGPVYDQPGTIKKLSLWFQPDHILGHIWFQADHTLDHIWVQAYHGKIIVRKFVWFLWCHNMVRLWSAWSGNQGKKFPSSINAVNMLIRSVKLTAKKICEFPSLFYSPIIKNDSSLKHKQ